MFLHPEDISTLDEGHLEHDPFIELFGQSKQIRII